MDAWNVLELPSIESEDPKAARDICGQDRFRVSLGIIGEAQTRDVMTVPTEPEDLLFILLSTRG